MLKRSLLLSLGFLLAACSGVEEDIDANPGQAEVAGNYLICDQSFKASLIGPEYSHFRLPPAGEARTVTLQLDAKFDTSVGLYLGVDEEVHATSFIFIDGKNTVEEENLSITFTAEQGKAYKVEVSTTGLDDSDSAEREYTLQTTCE